MSWITSLDEMNYDSDIVFIGDSITKEGDFQSAFPDYSIVNLGIVGNTIWDVDHRREMIESVKPEKIFLLVGINSLSNRNINKCAEKYETLINNIRQENPNAKIYIQSVLPLSKNQERKIANNESIVKFNKIVNDYINEASLEDVYYVELYDLFEKNGYMNDDYTRDGLHLTPEGYEVWYDNINLYITH